MTIRVKNTGVPDIIRVGQTLVQNVYYTIEENVIDQKILWANDTEVIADVNSGLIVVNNGTSDLSAANGLIWLQQNNATHLDGKKIDTSGIGDQKKIIYDSASDTLKFSAESPGSAAGAKGHVQIRGNQAGVFDATADLMWDDNKLALEVGGDIGNVGGVGQTTRKNRNSWVQDIVQNTNAGTQASSDFVAMNDAGTDSSGFVDVGINSSTYNDPAYALSLAGDSYIYCDGGNLTVGTYTALKELILHTGGYGSDKERLRFTDAAAAKDALAILKSVLILDKNTTANRPATPQNGMLRYNTSTNKFEGYENGLWINIVGGAVQERVVPIYLSIGAGHIHTSHLTFDEASDLMRGIISNVVRESSSDNGHSHTLTITWNSTTAKFQGTIASNHNHVFGTYPVSPYVANMVFATAATPYIEVTNTTYTAIGRILFPGSGSASLDTIKAIYQLGGGTNMAIKIQDITNATTIAEATGLSSGTTAIVSLGAVSNVPASEAMFEVQLKCTGGSPKARCSSIFLKGG